MSDWKEQGQIGAISQQQYSPARPLQRSLSERLGDERAALTSRIADIDKVLEALAKNPEVESLINLISKYT